MSKADPTSVDFSQPTPYATDRALWIRCALGRHPLLVRPAGVRLVPAGEGLRCTVAARTFRGTHVTVHLQPEDAPRLEAACALRAAPEVGDEVGVEFDAADIAVLG